jgi:ankyrin repeat protein
MGAPGRPNKSDPRLESAISDVKNSNNSKVTALLTEIGIDSLDGYQRTLLIWSAFYGNTELLKWLMSRGANINHQDRIGYTALHFVAQERRHDIAQILLDGGADLEIKDIHGNTAAWTAVFNARGKYETLKLFIQHGANVDNVNNAGRTPRQMAESMFPADFEKIKQELGI